MIAIQILAVDFPAGYIGIQLPEIPSATIPGLNLSSPTASRIRKQLKSKDFSSLERLLKLEGAGLQSSNPSKKRVSFADTVVSSPSETPGKPPSKPRTCPTRPSEESTRLEEKPKKPSVLKLNDPTTRRRGCETAYRECIVGTTSKPLGHNGANFPKFEQCSHEPLTCTDCVAKHITITLESRKPLVPENEEDMRKIASAVWSLCSCPQCDTFLTEETLFSALSRADMGLISALVAVKTREESPRWFSCISPTCNSGQLHPVIIKNGVEVQKVTCVACGLESCFYHRHPWHEVYTCAQYDDNHPLAKSETSSAIKIKQMTKKCPTKGCGWRISKDGGCGTIRCECFPSPCLRTSFKSQPLLNIVQRTHIHKMPIHRSFMCARAGIKCNQYWYWGSVRYEIKRRL